jgi:hypothetical protein
MRTASSRSFPPGGETLYGDERGDHIEETMAADEDDKAAGGTGQTEARSGSDRRQRKRAPVTIDLTADDVPTKPAGQSVKPAAPAAPEPAQTLGGDRPHAGEPRPAEPPRASEPLRPAGAPPPPRASAFAGITMDEATMRNLVIGAAGGLIALVVAIVLQAIGILPAPGRSAANEAAEQARAAANATLSLERRLTAIEAMAEGLPAMRADTKALADRISTLEARQAGMATRSDVEGVIATLGTLRQRLDEIPPAAARSDLDVLAERIGRLEVAAATGASGPGSEAAISSLASQIGNAETGIRALSERLRAAEEKMAALGANPMAGGDAAVRAIAVTALRRAAEGSEPFTTEVDMIAAVGIAGDTVADLRPIAARGVPAKADLVAKFPAVADAILAATSTADPNAGFLQRMLSGLGSLVSIRPAGPIAGSDPPAIVSRMTADVAKGDLTGALAEREALPEAGKAASADWAASAADRVALDGLVERIARAVEHLAG